MLIKPKQLEFIKVGGEQLAKEEAMDFISDVAIDCSQTGDRVAAEATSLLLQAIDKSYIQLCEIKVTAI